MATTEVRVTASFPLERPTDRMRRLAQGAAYKLQVLRGEVLNVDAAVLRLRRPYPRGSMSCGWRSA
jgi:hypothetical protein